MYIADEISIEDMLEEVNNDKAAFVCGNGFSINFDSGFSEKKLAENLFETHCHIVKNNSINYYCVSNQEVNKVLNTNFKAVLKDLRNINSYEQFKKIFEQAADFAYNVCNNQDIIDWIEENKDNKTLVFGNTSLSLLNEIANQATEKGALNVNCEYWTIAIYYVLVLSKHPSYLSQCDNLFVTLVLTGAQENLLKIEGIPECEFLINGFYTYYRFLFCSNILLGGKAFNVANLKNWNKCICNSVYDFLNKFDYLLTTNYDLILESILPHKSIYHLHGKFDKKSCISYYQCLSVRYDHVSYDITSIVLGDYFFGKLFNLNVAFQANKQDVNTPSINIEVTIKNIISNVHTLIIFGLSPVNDYHIIRHIQLACRNHRLHLIFCYYNEADRKNFLSIFDKCNSYSAEYRAAIDENITISLCQSQKIIGKYFVA